MVASLCGVQPSFVSMDGVCTGECVPHLCPASSPDRGFFLCNGITVETPWLDPSDRLIRSTPNWNQIGRVWPPYPPAPQQLHHQKWFQWSSLIPGESCAAAPLPPALQSSHLESPAHVDTSSKQSTHVLSDITQPPSCVFSSVIATKPTVLIACMSLECKCRNLWLVFFSANMSVVRKIHHSPQPHCDFLFYDYLSSLSLVNPRSPVKNEFLLLPFLKKNN